MPAAFVSINTVNMLCDLLLSGAEQVRGCAAISLGYLSYNHKAERQLLNRWVSESHGLDEMGTSIEMN